MKWEGRRQSSNIEDRRGRNVGGMGGAGLMRLGPGGLILLLVLAMVFRINPLALIGGGEVPRSMPETRYEETAETQKLEDFSAVVLGDLEDCWHKIFQENGREYKEPTLVFYDRLVDTACGRASSQTGPFYCPGDQNIYIDLSFYNELKNKFKAPGDFAFAYVLAHENGHHVQKLLGITDQVMALRDRMSEEEFNTQYLVRLELQADYFAGVFARYAANRGYLEVGDVEEAMNAASAVGDDTIQRRMVGRVMPDRFTHGTAEQRMRWFMKGYESGNLQDGDTFSVREP